MEKQAEDMMLLKGKDQKRSSAFCVGIWVLKSLQQIEVKLDD